MEFIQYVRGICSIGRGHDSTAPRKYGFSSQLKPTAPWTWLQGAVEFVSRTNLHVERGIGFTVLWNGLVKPIPWCRGIGSHFNNITIVIINIIIVINMNNTQT